jgi:hypothetical protein
MVWVMTTRSLLGGNQRFGGIHCIHSQGFRRKKDVSEEKFIVIYQVARRHNPENYNINLQSHWNRKSRMKYVSK